MEKSECAIVICIRLFFLVPAFVFRSFLNLSRFLRYQKIWCKYFNGLAWHGSS